MSKRKLDITLTILAVCGIIGPIIYTTVLFTLGLLQPSYNHVTQYMSELGEVGAPNAIIMNTLGFPILGLFLIAFAFGLHHDTNRGKGSKIAPTLVAVSGVGLILSGIFNCDPGCRDISFKGHIHSYAAMLAAIPMTFAPLVSFQRFEKNYQFYSLITGVVAGIISILYQFPFFEPWKGAFQRIAMGVPLLWVEVVSIKLLLSARTSIHNHQPCM